MNSNEFLTYLEGYLDGGPGDGLTQEEVDKLKEKMGDVTPVPVSTTPYVPFYPYYLVWPTYTPMVPYCQPSWSNVDSHGGMVVTFGDLQTDETDETDSNYGIVNFQDASSEWFIADSRSFDFPGCTFSEYAVDNLLPHFPDNAYSVSLQLPSSNG